LTPIKINAWHDLYINPVRRFILIFLFINFYVAAYNQVIKGTVLDYEKKGPIGFASLYFSGTSSGTQSDQKGNFELDVSKNASIPLTISAIGYYSSTLTDFSTDKPHIIYMTPKTYQLREVSINAKSLAKKRKANLVLFKNVFLGTTTNAGKCEIINENDITFNYESDDDTLKAFASKPILIDNRGLGYKITYYLDKFEYYKNSKSFFIKGNVIFNDVLPSIEVQKQSIERRRRAAYLVSRMHFFRALWANDLKSAGFIVKNPSGRNLNYKDIVIKEDSRGKFLRYPENLDIFYYAKLPIGQISFLKERVYFDNSGYFDSLGISWEGEFASQRVGELLPYDYSVKE
jgi:hypothetical protein